MIKTDQQYNELMAILWKRRKDLKLSGQQFADKLGIERTLASKQLNSSNIKLKNFINLCNILNLKINIYESDN